MKKNNTLTILVSSYACGPFWGSEVGMGWNWIINLADKCQLIVITEQGFKNDIEREIVLLNLKFVPQFYYINIGEKGRNLFWKQGSAYFYYHYNIWQKKAYDLSSRILENNSVQIVHQLNLIGFREPGYMWKHGNKYPFIWGPLGGISQIPFNYILNFEFKNLLFYSVKNLIHYFQLSFSKRVLKALSAAKFVIAESTNTQKRLYEIFRIKSTVIHESGSFIPNHQIKKSPSKQIKLIWVGKIQGTKALPIALKALKNTKEKENFHLTIIGDGPDTDYCKKLVGELKIAALCSFTGKIPNKKVYEKMEESDLLFFTSLKEGTATVVLEALSFGTPVLCHDTCGFGDIINEDCGIKIPMISYNKSIVLFSQQLSRIDKDRSILTKLSDGALKELKFISWENNANKMYNVYLKAVNDLEKNIKIFEKQI